MPESVYTEVVGNVAIVRLNRPDTRNALDAQMMEELAGHLERLDGEPHSRCIVLVGCDEAFASGPNVNEMAQQGVPDPGAAAFWSRVAGVETPMVAAVAGWALGHGCELALLCDLVIADDTAVFGQPEITLGIIPGGGATQRLTRVLGKQRAMELVLTGRRFDGDMGFQWGLVNLVAARGRHLQEAMEIAHKIGNNPPLATRYAKKAVLAADEAGLAEGLVTERRLYEQAMATEDRVEGMRAFLEKRKPDYEGR